LSKSNIQKCQSLGPLPWGVFLILGSWHLVLLYKYAINAPWMDDWTQIPGITQDFNLPWILAPHNEHRIIPTKLLIWLQYHLDGMNYRRTIGANFLVYLALIWSMARSMLSSTWQRVMFVIMALSAASIENHSWAFQNQFHFFILSFVMALITQTRPLISVALAFCGVFSFSSGVICAAALSGYWLYLALRGNKNRIKHIILASVVLISIGFWAMGFHQVPGHPEPTLPMSLSFWEYFGNIISLGFGFNESLSPLPGYVLFCVVLAFIMFSLNGYTSVSGDKENLRLSQAVLAAGALGCLAVIAIGRAGFGVQQAKSSRYAEIGILLMPAVLSSLELIVQRVNSINARKIIYCLVTLALLTPFFEDRMLSKIYEKSFAIRVEEKDCIRRYYVDNGSGACPGFVADLTSYLELAKRLNMSIYSENL
jgi:hypothetical protein